jgi:eukaryotic-like serine/threonine-protein kinase
MEQRTEGVVPELPKPEPQPDVPGQIGRYKIEGLLERGGMSLLYLGVYPETQEPIIVKVLSPKYLSNPDVVARFLNEAQIISVTDHQNIIKLYDYGKWENGLYIAMEFIRGSSLRKILTHQPLSLKRALEVILQIAYALCHLHTHGVIHRDLKPENILITDEGQVKVIDFGIAQMLTERKELHKEEAGKLIGTPIYMSPEARDNPDTITFQSDIYSLGIIAYELVLGKITHGRVILSLAPRGIQKILNKALQQRPEDRYQDIVDFITDISTYLNSTEVEKDKQGSDYFFELFEHMEQFQGSVLPEKIPEWPEVEIGLTHIVSIGMNGLYYDFFDLGEKKKLIVIAEAEAKGAEGLLYSAMFRTLCRSSIKRAHPVNLKDFFAALQNSIADDVFAQAFAQVYLLVDFQKNSFEYIASDSYGLLIPQKQEHEQKEQKTNKKISTDYNYYQGSLSSNERFILVGYPTQLATTAQPLSELLKAVYKETSELPPQKQVETLLRKMRFKGELASEDHPLVICCLQLKK